MNIQWFGTASVLLQSKQQSILFDPFVPLQGSTVPVKLADYDGYDTIFVTHGHFDHILSIPEIYKRNPAVKIYCTKTPYQTLLAKGVSETALVEIGFGQTITYGDFTIRTYHGKHAILPKNSLKQLVRVITGKPLRNLPYIGKENRICRENDETVMYEVTAEGKRILIMGSLNLRDEIAYPTDCDVLILPYNGWNDNYPPAVKAVERLKPRQILLDHYDDTFPPLTGPIDLTPVLEKYGEVIRPCQIGVIEHFE